MRVSGDKDSTVLQFAKIVRTASMAASWESHIMLGTCLSAVDKKCMARVILSSTITWSCVRYVCKYSDVSVISSDLVLLEIAWIQR